MGTNNFISHPRWYVLGTDGSLQIDDWDCSGKYVRCIDKQCIWEKEIKEVKMGPSKTMAPRSNDSVETVQLTSPSDVFDYLDVVYMQLTDAIEGKCALKITAEQALRVMRVIETAFKSNKEGIVVKTEI